MLLTLIAALAAGPAHADEVSAEVFGQASPSGQLATGFGARLEAGKPFVAAEGFGYTDGHWLGRATAGVDVLGNSDRLDLTLGLFLGTTGEWNRTHANADMTAGFELGLGANMGPLGVRYRRVDGFRGPLEDRLTQDELRVGWLFGDTVQVFAQYVNFTPRQDERIGGYGGGVNVRF